MIYFIEVDTAITHFTYVFIKLFSSAKTAEIIYENFFVENFLYQA